MKTDGPATQHSTRNTRSVRDRLATLPPIQFLKRYSTRLRRHRPTLGFDQPPRELKELAIPARSAAPSGVARLGMRVRLQFARTVARSAFILGRVSLRVSQWSQRITVPMRAAAARVQVVTHQGLERVAVRLERLQPAPWEATQTTALLARTRRVRRCLLGLLACEWVLTAGLALVACGMLVRGHALGGSVVNACGLIMCLLGLGSLTLLAWHQRLTAAWRGLELFICGRCGELRNFSPSMPCPVCGDHSAPAFPGQVPTGSSSWDTAMHVLPVGAPAVIFALVCFAGRLMASATGG